MIGLRKTYQDVARELSEGLNSGTITLVEDENDLAALSFFLFQFLSPTRLAYGTTAGAEAMTASRFFEVEIPPEVLSRLSSERKAELEMRIKELGKKGVSIILKSPQEKSFTS